MLGDGRTKLIGLILEGRLRGGIRASREAGWSWDKKGGRGYCLSIDSERIGSIDHGFVCAPPFYSMEFFQVIQGFDYDLSINLKASEIVRLSEQL